MPRPPPNQFLAGVASWSFARDRAAGWLLAFEPALRIVLLITSRNRFFSFADGPAGAARLCQNGRRHREYDGCEDDGEAHV
jgi:hypothetical protein